MIRVRIGKFKRVDLLCTIPALFFIILTRHYWGETPPLDSMVYFRQTTEFYTHGLSATFQNNYGMLHPPLFFQLQSIFFAVFGVSPASYTLFGYCLLTTTSVIFYFAVKHIFNRRTALIATLLLFTNPHIIVSSFYPNPDVILLSVFILTLLSHTYNKKRLLLFCYPLLFLAKETGLIICAGFICIRLFTILFSHSTLKTKLRSMASELLICVPVIIIFSFWSSYANAHGSDWKFLLHEDTNESSYVMFTIKKILTLGFINTHLMQNIYNIFILNFQWIYALFLLCFAFFKKPPATGEYQRRFAHGLLVTSALYLCVALSFPTWTIPRYGIPMLLSLFFFLSLYLNQIKRPLLYIGIVILFTVITFVANVYSIDPITSRIGKLFIFNELLYDSKLNSNGLDGLVYNFQFIKPVSLQNRLIQRAIEEQADYIVADCNEFRLTERIEYINFNPKSYPQFPYTKNLTCISESDLSERVFAGDVMSQRFFIQKSPYEGIIQSF